MNVRESYKVKEATIKNSVRALCLLYQVDVNHDLFIDAIDDLKSTVPQIIRYTLFTFTEVCELSNWVSNLLRDKCNNNAALTSFLQSIYGDLDDVKVGLKYAMDALYNA